MNTTRTALRFVPQGVQSRFVERSFKRGSAFRAPAFAMLLHSLEHFGGDLAEIRAAVETPQARRASIADIFRGLGADKKRDATRLEAEGATATARESYHRAAVYYFCADWFGGDADGTAENYAGLLPCYDAYRALCDPPMEKVVFPCATGTFSAHFRAAPSRGPAVLIVQGNDEVKELNAFLEEMALAQRLSVLDVDPPGWGESWLSGARCRGVEDYQAAIRAAVDYLCARPEVDPVRIGVLGVSLGGLLAPYAAALDPRIAAAAGLGGPSWKPERWRSILSGAPAMQRKRGFLYSGVTTIDELVRWWRGMRIEESLSTLERPVFLVHGENDALVPPDCLLDNAALIKGPVRLRIVPGGDHMCTRSLAQDVGPGMFSWLKETLLAGPTL